MSVNLVEYASYPSTSCGNQAHFACHSHVVLAPHSGLCPAVCQEAQLFEDILNDIKHEHGVELERHLTEVEMRQELEPGQPTVKNRAAHSEKRGTEIGSYVCDPHGLRIGPSFAVELFFIFSYNNIVLSKTDVRSIRQTSKKVQRAPHRFLCNRNGEGEGGCVRVGRGR